MSGQKNPRNLRDLEGSGAVTVDKSDLRRDGLLDDDGEIPSDQQMWYDRLGDGVYLFRQVNGDGEVVELEECEAIRRIAAEVALEHLDDTGLAATRTTGGD